METESEKLELFLRDCATLSENLRWSFSGLRRHPADRTLVHEAFRFVHSLKSEAEMVHSEEIAALAHEMEGILDQMRGESITPSDGLPMLESMMEALPEMVDSLRSRAGAAEVAGAAETAGAGAPLDRRGAGGEEGNGRGAIEPGSGDTRAALHAGGGGGRPGFSEFELQLVREAVERGDTIYRLVCEIDESAPLKYPKAYLVTNNLEICANVIRGIPGPEGLDDASFRVFEIYCAGSISEEEIRASADVDQVKVTELAKMAGDSLLGIQTMQVLRSDFRAESDLLRSPRPWSTVRVENGKIDALFEQVGDLKDRLERIQSIARAARGPKEIGEEAQTASAIAAHLEGIVRSIRMVPIREEFERLAMLARDLATSLGKQVRFVTKGGELMVDRRLPGLLSEPLAHLIRNAVDHGIEPPDERAAVGKQIAGRVSVSAALKGGTLEIRVADDGRGVDERAVRERARALGLSAPKTGVLAGSDGSAGTGGARLPAGSDDLLSLLVRPGFSTRVEATRVSGRGVGLDLVNERVQVLLGGELHLESRPGAGSSFTLMLPAESAIMSLLVARWRGRTFAVPERNVERVSELVGSSVTKGRDGRLRYEGAPLVTVEGSAQAELVKPPASILLLDSSGERAALLVDELLFERDLPEARLELGAEEGHYLSHVLIGGREADFLYLNPATII